ncbi:MAG: ABC transporter permease [Eubacteriaceae bacterium]|uniref:ABC transporter permease n=1 Tax=Candidatus Pseudoramibacter fermentans TaxID=2594427 RepID=A0A6L5GSW7_9FIRM|nr:ABC transporter permease [Candidatus Pseudoramibacter fermentans]RRF93254.1 MAG: ABC transporter permease [Eubacteriaceae bacterium]
MKQRENRRASDVFLKIVVAVVMIFVYAPVAVMVVYSFNNSRANMIWLGFTTQYYKQLFQDQYLWSIFGTTLIIAAVATAIGTVVGTLGAVGFRKHQFFGKELIHYSMYFPIVIPEIVLGVALLLFFDRMGIELGMPTIIIGNATLILPYVYITVNARLVGMDPSIEEASYDLGADRGYTFFHVTLPAIMPGVLSGAFMSFSLVLDELIVTSFLASARITTLPIKVYSMVKKGVTPEINALSTIILFVCLGCVAAWLIVGGIKQKREREAREKALNVD